MTNPIFMEKLCSVKNKINVMSKIQSTKQPININQPLSSFLTLLHFFYTLAMYFF